MRAVLLGALALCMQPGPAAADTPRPGALYQDGQSGRYLLAGSWFKRADPRDVGVKRGWQRQPHLDGWRETTVPNAANAGNWSSRGYLGGVTWYRKDFELPRAGTATAWLVRFEAVNSRATGWLNGRRTGAHAGAYLPFELLARGARATGENQLVIRVDSRHRKLDVPNVARRRDGRYTGGWWNYGGILREVYLREVQRLDFASAFARPELPCRSCPATVLVQAIVANYDSVPVSAKIEGQIGGEQLTFTPATIGAGNLRYFRASVKIASPR